MDNQKPITQNLNSDNLPPLDNNSDVNSNFPNAQSQPSGEAMSSTVTNNQLPDNDNTYKNNNYEPEVQVVEKVVYQKEKRSLPSVGVDLNPFSLIKSIKRLTCFGCFTIIILFVILLGTIIFRPPVTWEPLKSFLNSGYNPPAEEAVEINEVREFIDMVSEQESDSFELSEAQVSGIMQGKFNKNTRVDIEESVMKLVIDIDFNSDKPLWLIIELSKNDQDKLEISKIGFERFGLPASIRGFVDNAAFKAMDLAQGNFKDQTSSSALSFLTEGNEVTLNIDNIEFGDDKIILEYEEK